MNTIIQLICDRDPGAITAEINDFTLVTKVTDNVITVSAELPNGLHYLKLVNQTDEIVNFTSISINGSELRQTKFLSWVEENNQKVQPATYIRAGAKFCLPFATPIGLWYGIAGSVIPSMKFGQDLYKEYLLYYPEKVKIDPSFPSWIKDFFENDFGFTAVPIDQKNNLKSHYLPYCELDMDIPNIDGLMEETKELFNTPGAAIKPPSTLDDRAYDPGKDAYWEKVDLFFFDRGILIDQEKFPNLTQFIKDLPAKGRYYAFIGKLEPGSYISPHRDNTIFYKEKSTCGQIYIPLNWPDGNYFKLQDVGLLPIKAHQPLMVNTQYYQHCLVNQSNETRYIFSVWCDISEHQFKLKSE